MKRYKSMAIAAGIVLGASLVSAGAASANVGNVAIINGVVGLCLDGRTDGTYSAGRDGDPIQLWQCDPNSPQQHWNFNENAGSYGTITNKFAGLCLDATNDPTHDAGTAGDTIQLWTCNGSAQQQWDPQWVETSGGVGWYELKNLYSDGTLVLDAMSDASHSPKTSGDPVQLWGFDGASASNQLWSF